MNLTTAPPNEAEWEHRRRQKKSSRILWQANRTWFIILAVMSAGRIMLHEDAFTWAGLALIAGNLACLLMRLHFLWRDDDDD